MKLNNLHPIEHTSFSGTFRLTGRVASFDDDGIPYLRIRLSSCANDYVALAVIDSLVIPEKLGHMELVTVKGQQHASMDGDVILLNKMHRPMRRDIALLPALQTLPRLACPKPEALDRLVVAVRSLKFTALQVFIKLVLERQRSLEVFLKAPASKGYHHNEAGGLLEHSLEVAQNVLSMIQANEPEMPRVLQEIGFVAGLLHDIGKTYTYDINGNQTAAARLCDHADLTLEACAQGLAYLDQIAPEVALTLRHIWTCASPGARYGTTPAMTLARYVRDADGQSAMADNQRIAYKHRPPAGFGRLGKNVFWMPSAQAYG